MRAPAPTLVVDAAILIAAVLGRGGGAMLEVSRDRVLVTTDRVVQEARRRIELGMRRPDLLEILDQYVEFLTVVPVSALGTWLEAGSIALRDAAASRNGSTQDAHVLALAWNVDGDIWTFDRDFAGTGVARWSTPNLMRQLDDRIS